MALGCAFALSAEAVQEDQKFAYEIERWTHLRMQVTKNPIIANTVKAQPCIGSIAGYYSLHLHAHWMYWLRRFAPLNKTKLKSILANIEEATKLLAAGK